MNEHDQQLMKDPTLVRGDLIVTPHDVRIVTRIGMYTFDTMSIKDGGQYYGLSLSGIDCQLEWTNGFIVPCAR